MAGIKHKDWRKLDKWEWPYLRFSDGPEYECPHGIGHSFGVHGCDGCCSHPTFHEQVKRSYRYRRIKGD